MRITIWDKSGTTGNLYIVLIDKHHYYMSRRQDRTNDVNMYAGELVANMHTINRIMKNLKFKKLLAIPTSLKYAIRQRCQEIRHNSKLQSNDEGL